MDFKSTRFGVAVALTVLDLVAAFRYGPVVWRALAPILWCRILLLLLVALMATSLARVWSRTRRIQGAQRQSRRIRLSPIESSPETERADV